jgi:hypothetical protein
MKICVIGETGILIRNAGQGPAFHRNGRKTRRRESTAPAHSSPPLQPPAPAETAQSIVIINKSGNGTWINENSYYHAVPHT